MKIIQRTVRNKVKITRQPTAKIKTLKSHLIFKPLVSKSIIYFP